MTGIQWKQRSIEIIVFSFFFFFYKTEQRDAERLQLTRSETRKKNLIKSHARPKLLGKCKKKIKKEKKKIGDNIVSPLQMQPIQFSSSRNKQPGL